MNATSREQEKREARKSRSDDLKAAETLKRSQKVSQLKLMVPQFIRNNETRQDLLLALQSPQWDQCSEEQQVDALLNVVNFDLSCRNAEPVEKLPRGHPLDLEFLRQMALHPFTFDMQPFLDAGLAEEITVEQLEQMEADVSSDPEAQQVLQVYLRRQSHHSHASHQAQARTYAKDFEAETVHSTILNIRIGELPTNLPFYYYNYTGIVIRNKTRSVKERKKEADLEQDGRRLPNFEQGREAQLYHLKAFDTPIESVADWRAGTNRHLEVVPANMAGFGGHLNSHDGGSAHLSRVTDQELHLQGIIDSLDINTLLDRLPELQLPLDFERYSCPHPIADRTPEKLAGLVQSIFQSHHADLQRRQGKNGSKYETFQPEHARHILSTKAAFDRERPLTPASLDSIAMLASHHLPIHSDGACKDILIQKDITMEALVDESFAFFTAKAGPGPQHLAHIMKQLRGMATSAFWDGKNPDFLRLLPAFTDIWSCTPIHKLLWVVLIWLSAYLHHLQPRVLRAHGNRVSQFFLAEA